MAYLVGKVECRRHWEDWPKDISIVVHSHIAHFRAIIKDKKNKNERHIFTQFSGDIRQTLNKTISDEDILEMLAQHLVTKPVFDAFFSLNTSVSQNPMSKAMENVLECLQKHSIPNKLKSLQPFYESVKLQLEDADTAEAKQRVIIDSYDNFFRNAFPKMSKRLGIVYTPVEIVDFILRSVDHLLRSEFGCSLGSPGVHILDPFTGTGTFITRLIQTGLIDRRDLKRKYQKEIHANDIVLLAYYIASTNIELAYHVGSAGEYTPFKNICLADAFECHGQNTFGSPILNANTMATTNQSDLDIRVIIGNPPYSAGQKDDNDDAANTHYPTLDARLASTYVKRSTGNPRSLYDSYVRAIRWSSDRLGRSGIIGFITNAGFIDGKAADGLRRCLAEEFSSLYVFHLRGNQRVSGEAAKKEGAGVFGSGTRSPVAISFFVKNPSAEHRGVIRFFDIGDNLNRLEKLRKIERLGSIDGISQKQKWTAVCPDKYADWICQRRIDFTKHMIMGAKQVHEAALFKTYSAGVKTNRDAWAYAPSKTLVLANAKRMLGVYNSLLSGDKKEDHNDATKIGWSWVLRQRFDKGQKINFTPSRAVVATYRPFQKRWLYYDRFFNENRYQMPRLFPEGREQNRVIVIKQRWTGEGQFALMVDHVADVQPDGGCQCFPLYLYETASPSVTHKNIDQDKSWSENAPSGSIRKSGLTKAGLNHFQAVYNDASITEEVLFYYIYGILHSCEYRQKFNINLRKELPRIPCVRRKKDFDKISRIGRALGDLHVNFENHPECKSVKVSGPQRPTIEELRVEQMKFGRRGDKTTIDFNKHYSITSIPLAAYEYIINGKSAIEWVMDRHSQSIDKRSGIANDPNTWATDTMQDPRHILSLLLRVISLSVETNRLVSSLPSLDVGDVEIPKIDKIA